MAKILKSSDCGLDGLTFHLPSKVQPQFARDSDIGVIVNRFLKTGQLPSFTEKPTIKDGLSLPEDFQTLMDTTRAVREKFDLLPEDERQKYNNSCDNWLAALAEKANAPADPAPADPAPVPD